MKRKPWCQFRQNLSGVLEDENIAPASVPLQEFPLKRHFSVPLGSSHDKQAPANLVKTD
jgi:hypothetical protein